jgi:hypothetical protein
MKSLRLHVPVLDNGRMTSNLGAPEAQMFKGKPANRDLIQNPRDAWIHSGKSLEERGGLPPVLVRIERVRLRTADLPCIGAIHANLGHCEACWSHLPAEREVFARALEALGGATVDCLKIGDYNTTGAPGLDHEIHKPWYIMTRGLGVTTKDGGQGGSKGLGKVTAFLLSDIGTVFFGTRLPDGRRNFVGDVFASTFTHRGPGLPHEWQNMWIVGQGRGESVTDPALIPPFMDRTQTGTDLVIAAHSFGKNWVARTAYDIAESWWLGIERGEIRVEILDGVSKSPKRAVVDKGSLGAFLKGDAKVYHRAHSLGQVRLHGAATIGDCTTRTLTGPAAAGMKSFAMTRDNGMVVFERRLDSNEDFCGVFECTNKRGNEVLRLMESATHDAWSHKEHADKEVGRRAEDEYMEIIRSVRDDINRAGDSDDDEPTGLADLLPLESLEWEGDGTFRAEPTERKRERRLVQLGGKGHKKTFEVENLVAMVAGADEGEYELEVHHPEGAEDAMIAVGIAGDANVVDIAEVRAAEDGEGTPIGVDPVYNTIGPLRLAKGPNTVRVDIDDMRRLAVQVFQMKEVVRKRRPKGGHSHTPEPRAAKGGKSVLDSPSYAAEFEASRRETK